MERLNSVQLCTSTHFYQTALCTYMQAPYCHVIIVVTAFLHGVVSERISVLLSDLQPLECRIFSSQTEEMHAQLLPVSEGEGLGERDLDYSLEGYSHFGEFQALMRKWINREVIHLLHAARL